MKKWSSAIALISLNLLLTVGLTEFALRLFPTFISADRLIHFEPTLRSALATGRFPTADNAIAFNRDDGGSPFSIWKPFAKINYSFNDPGTVNTVTMDEMGFCNAPGLYSQQSQFEILTIGDSLIWCTTVHPKDTWVAQLAEIAQVSTYNLGTPAIGPYEYLQLLERFGLQKSPKIVILNVYEGNDLRDALNYLSSRYSDVRKSSHPAEKPAENFGALSRYSYAWNLLKANFPHSQPQPKSITADYSSENENFRYDLIFESGTVPFNLQNGDLDEVAYAKQLITGKVSLDAFSEALDHFTQLAKTTGFYPVVVYTPSAYTAYANAVSFEQPELTAIMPAYSQQLRDFFADQAVTLGYEFVDLTPFLQAAASEYTTPEKLLYYQTNRHLTKYGHKIIAEALNQTIGKTIKKL